MSSSLPPTHDPADPTLHAPQPPDGGEQASTAGALAADQDPFGAAVPDLDQRIRNVGEW